MRSHISKQQWTAKEDPPRFGTALVRARQQVPQRLTDAQRIAKLGSCRSDQETDDGLSRGAVRTVCLAVDRHAMSNLGWPRL